MVKSTALRSSAIRDLLQLTEQPHVRSLAGGLPDPSSFPVAAIADAAAESLATDPSAALQYGPTEGHRPLRAWVANRLGAPVDEVLITTGSQQALDLLARALLEPGDVVAIAEPAYIGALQAFRAQGAVLAPIPSGRHGLDVDALAEQLRAGLRPTFAYVVSNFDNPSGTTLGSHGREALAALAEHYGFWIVDDDPYGDLRWHGCAPTPLRHMTERTISVGSTSKVLCPGLRVGWAVGPAEVLRPLTILKQAADLHSSTLSQQIAYRVLVRPGFLDAHLAGLRTTYRGRAEALATCLRARFGDDLSFADPTGGMFVWARFDDRCAIDTTVLLPHAIASGVAYVPGAAFAVGDPAGLTSHLRLSFATNDVDQLAEAVDRLGVAIDTAAQMRHDPVRPAQ